MLDDLRNSASNSFQEEEEPLSDSNTAVRRRPARSNEPFLGMTPQQRFVIALLIFMMVSVLGMLTLVVTQKVCIGCL
jgi:hypothetical protein